MPQKKNELKIEDFKSRKEEKRWAELIDAVMKGKVIPVIGADFLVDKDDDNVGNLHQQIIDILANFYNVKSNPATFSQLVYDKDFQYGTNNDKRCSRFGNNSDI